MLRWQGPLHLCTLSSKAKALRELQGPEPGCRPCWCTQGRGLRHRNWRMRWVPVSSSSKAAKELPKRALIVATDRGIFYKMQQACREMVEAPTGGDGATCHQRALPLDGDERPGGPSKP